MKRLLILLGIILTSAFVGVRVFASPPTPYIVICHHTPSNSVTLTFQNLQSYLGHLGTPHNNETYDTQGVCSDLTPTVTPTPTSTPTPTPPCFLILAEYIKANPCITPSPTVTQEPIATPTPTFASATGYTEADHNQSKEAPGCSNLPPSMVNDVWYTDYGIVGNVAHLTLHWGMNDNYPSVNIAYGENMNEWRYGVQHIDNNGQFTIDGLKPHQHYWFQVGYVLGCATGPYSHPIDP